MSAMDNNTAQTLLAGVVGVNTIATFTMAYLVGCYKGGLDSWRKGVDDRLSEQKLDLASIHQQDIRNITMDSQMKRQNELVKLLGKRTHELRNVLTGLNLIPKTADMSGFDEPVTGGD